MFNLIIYLFLVFGTIFYFPINLHAAEVLQVQSSSLLRIGDQNRTYTVKLSCLEVDELNEVDAFEFLKSNLPRRTKVNLFPQGVKEGILLAKVVPIKTQIDLGEEISKQGFGENICAE